MHIRHLEQYLTFHNCSKIFCIFLMINIDTNEKSTGESNEKISKPRISPEFVTFWLHKFRKLDINRLDHRKWLIQVFVNAIYLYDDKMIITFNYKDGTATITLDDVKRAIQKDNPGSDLDCLAAPSKKERQMPLFFYL